MLAQDFIDAVVVFLMFGLRIGLPIALTLAFGYWLEKKLRPAEQIEDQTAQPQEQRWTRSGKIIQIHCWDIKRCDTTTRAQCAAVQHPDLPCWLALQAEGENVRQECFTCSLYRPQSKVA